MVVKTGNTFFCPKINASVQIEYCIQLKDRNGKESDTVKQIINPDCEQKDRCDIAQQQNGETVYDWSGCAHPELKMAVW